MSRHSKIRQARSQHRRELQIRSRRRHTFESLERREVFSGTPLPVLLVIADQQDFFYQEYGDTYNSLVARDVDVVVAAKTTNPSTAHAGTGQGAGSGVVVPDIALEDVDAADYSAIAFVGGWGSSMYQYAFTGDYDNNLYDGDAGTKQVVNDLIGDFIEQDKYVAGVCNGVTVLAWARIDGVSPLAGRTVAVPYIGSPGATYEGIYYGNYGWAQPQQMEDNGISYFPSGAIGVAGDVTDDVWVDGQFITAENNFTAAYFGDVIADYVIAAAEETQPPPGPISHAGPNLLVQGTASADTVYLWTNHTGQQFVWLNGEQVGPITMAAGGRVIVYGGDGNDQIFATDNALPVTIYGQGGHDLITGGSADDIIDGGDGRDRIWAGPGNDLIFGGAGTDSIDGREGNDVLLGGDGDDYLYGGTGLDVLIGNTGGDRLDGGDGDDLLIGGSTSFDNNNAALNSLLADWTAADRSSRVTVSGAGGTFTLTFNGQTTGVQDDGVKDTLLSGAGDDWLLTSALDYHDGSQASDRIFGL